MPKSCETLAEFKEILGAGKPVVVDFTATWCGPCRMIAPIFEKLAEENPQATFIKVDVDDNDETVAEYDIQAMPTFKIFVGGEEKGMCRGANEQALRKMVADHAKPDDACDSTEYVKPEDKPAA